MSKTHLIIPDPHAVPGTDNNRADWIGELIKELKPDVVINGGDMWDMDSLSSYDKGKASFYGRKYKADIDAGKEFDERLWAPIKTAKKRLPFRVFLEGNHEHRIKRMLEYQHELEGTVGFKDLELNKNYDAIVQYDGSTPGMIQIDGINYAHYFTSGVKGLPISGLNPARGLLYKTHESCTSFHLHTLDWAVETKASGKRIMGLFAGVGHERKPGFAGLSSQLWFPCVIIKRNVSDGFYEPQFISLETLRKEYSTKA